ncbi:MAG: hypothetical protein EXQ56_06555 [Acidobacteria bacterium]|nr:hypothetical protein [Acidobacteriota bacterium]
MMTHDMNRRLAYDGQGTPPARPAPLLRLLRILQAAMLLALYVPALMAADGVTREAANSARAKLKSIQGGAFQKPGIPGNIESMTVSPDRIHVSQQESNSLLALDLAGAYPNGVSAVEVEFQSGRVLGTAQLDFDLLKQSAPTPVPLVWQYLLFGQHALRVEGQLSGTNGQGEFKLEAVTLNGYPVPQILIDALMSIFMTPRFPSVKLDEPFSLPYSIDSLTVLPGRIEVAGSDAAKL